MAQKESHATGYRRFLPCTAAQMANPKIGRCAGLGRSVIKGIKSLVFGDRIRFVKILNGVKCD
jgi:hypothetical protein